MGIFKSIFSVTSLEFHAWKKDLRICFVLLFTIMMVKKYLDSVVACGLQEGVRATFCVLPALFRASSISVGAPKIIFHVGLLILLCDAPFFRPISPYMIVRSRRNRWWIGNVLYILGTAFFYLLFITLIGVLCVLPVATWGNEWGDAFNYFVYGSAAQDDDYFVRTYGALVPYSAVMYAYPYGAQLYTFLTVWASFSFLGLLMYFVSIYQNKTSWSIACAGIFIFLEPVLNWFADLTSYCIQYFSPLCWSSFDYLDLINPQYRLHIPFIAILSILLIVILIIAIWRRSQKVVIELR